MMYKVTQGGIRQHHHDSKKDLEAVLKELRDDVQPFMRVPGCVHGSHNYKLCTNLINTVPHYKFMKWMKSKWTQLLAGLL